MRTVATIVGVLLILAGGVWILQGLNIAFAPQSFMTGNRQWVVYGVLTSVAGLGLLLVGRRRP